MNELETAKKIIEEIKELEKGCFNVIGEHRCAKDELCNGCYLRLEREKATLLAKYECYHKAIEEIDKLAGEKLI